MPKQAAPKAECTKPAFLDHFETLKDPRSSKCVLYTLSEILLVVICGMICNARSWRDFALFGRLRIETLRRFLPYENGIPSKNTFARLFANLDPGAFQECFLTWMLVFQTVISMDRDIIALDGKSLRGSLDKALGQTPIHTVSAFATKERLILGQKKVSGKSNEITAIPQLLETLDLENKTVTIDAMGTQKTIAKKIRERKGDYCLALKKNHSTLFKNVQLFFLSEINKLESKEDNRKDNDIVDISVTHDKGHGRIEKRTCYATNRIDWLKQKDDWCDLQTIFLIESHVTVGHKTTTQKRYFISSHEPDAKLLNDAIRSHWGIESMHWILDVSMGEDRSRVRKDHAPENMAIMRRFVFNLLQKTKQKKKDISIKGLQRGAGWGDQLLFEVLMQI
jgi:predicted transposase YbfD/YdcC